MKIHRASLLVQIHRATVKGFIVVNGAVAKSSDAALLYTIPDKAILGALGPKDGSLVWHRSLTGQPVEGAVAMDIDSTDSRQKFGWT